MNIFKTKGVVLKISKAKEKDFIYTIFTSDYGKILCNKKLAKKEKTLDLGYLINFEVEVSSKREIHKIKNIKITREFDSRDKKFKTINSYMQLLSIVLNNSPEGHPISKIYEVFENLYLCKEINNLKILLCKLKILNILGILQIDNENLTVAKILKFISNNEIDTVLRLGGVSEEVFNILGKNIDL